MFRAESLLRAGEGAQPLSPARSAPVRLQRPRVEGKFLYVGPEKFWIRGVTYGTFRPNEYGQAYDPETVDRDFAKIAAYGLNAIRTYTVPPRWLLDAADSYGLRVMVGLPWEQHVAFLDDRDRARAIEEKVRRGVWACAGHPALLGYAIGNEIPASIVRWHGHRAVERYIERLFHAARAEDPDGLITYVNYPTTEFLTLPFLDFLCFNVYLESQERLSAYLARLQNLAGERPLVMAELGLDSRRHGEETQAHVLDWQIRTSFAAGCAGVFVFSWTDEWYRGGFDIEDWDFGLTDRERRPKPSLRAVREAFNEVPFPNDHSWPRVSVVVCSYNGSRTIRDCFEGLLRLEYPNFEVIVVDDGSIDLTAAITRKYGFRLISTTNRGLSSARNTGLEAATGEIVAYIDDDARPDPHWLTFLASTFLTTNHVGVGGPNIAPLGDGPIADCVANAPGGPVHVLLSDREAEHIPGCNMAFRKSALQAIGGFDPQFRTAGDDVDVCWRLQQRGWSLGFNPAAMVWHHRRNSVRAYWRQQEGYGKAEALLERKWPEKYNAVGHVGWAGRLYGRGLSRVLCWPTGRIYQGTWGSAFFQRLYQPVPGLFSSLPLMPEWYLIVGALAGLSLLGALWSPLFLVLPLLGLSLLALLVQAGLGAAEASFPDSTSRLERLKLRGLTALLHLIQPLARLRYRLHLGLTPWRFRCFKGFGLPLRRRFLIWSERWQAPHERLHAIQAALRAEGASANAGGEYDRWDLEVQGGILGGARTLMGIEEHGAGRQLVRFRIWPRYSPLALVLTGLFGSLSIVAGKSGAWSASALLGLGALLLGLRAVLECGAAISIITKVLARVRDQVIA